MGEIYGELKCWLGKHPREEELQMTGNKKYDLEAKQRFMSGQSLFLVLFGC